MAYGDPVHCSHCGDPVGFNKGDPQDKGENCEPNFWDERCKRAYEEARSKMQSPENRIPTPKEVRDRLEVLWSQEASTLLEMCIVALEDTSHVGARVNIPKGTTTAAVKRVILALEAKGWEAERDTGSNIPACSGAWDNLDITQPNPPSPGSMQR